MLAPVLDALVAYDPTDGTGSPLATFGMSEHGSALYQKGERAFLARYRELHAGWVYAGRYANARVRFPIPMLGRDHWVFAAYLMRLDAERYYNKYIGEAFHFANPVTGTENMRHTMRGMLLSYTEDTHPDAHLARVAERMRVPLPTLQAFESLFFNVFDRRMDSICLAMNVYPDGRLVEMNDNYFRDTPLGKILERAGYNFRDLDLVSHLAGIGDKTYMAKLAATENGEAELTRHIMGNGLLFTKTNMLNHKSPGWSRVATLLSAARQSGTQTEDPPLADIGPGFYKELAAATRISRAETVAMMREDAGVVDVEMVPG